MRMPRSGVWPAFNVWHLGPIGVVIIVATFVTFSILERRSPPRARRALLGGVLAAALVSSDVQLTSMTNYRSHMIEHLVVALVIAPLLASATTIRWSKPLSTAGFLGFTALIPLFHLTRLGGLAMSTSFGHALELLSFLVVGVAFWIPVYGAGRTLSDRQRLTYVLLALPIVATTGLVLWSSTRVSLGITDMNMRAVSLADVHGGGYVMMTWGSAAMLANLAVVVATSAWSYHRRWLPVGRRYA